MSSINFKFWKFPAGRKMPVSKPIIPVTLIDKNGGAINLACLVDSGADQCFLPAKWIGEEILGLEIDKGEKVESFGINGKPFDSYLHLVEYKIGGWPYKVKMAFSYDLAVPYGVLGTKGFLEFFKVCIDHRKEEIEIKI